MTANARIADTRRRLALIQRRRGLAIFATWNELAAWRTGMADQVETRVARMERRPEMTTTSNRAGCGLSPVSPHLRREALQPVLFGAAAALNGAPLAPATG